MGPRAAERIHPKADGRAANGFQVEHVGEISNVGVEIFVSVRCGGAKSLLDRNPFHPCKVVPEKLVRLRFNPTGNGLFRRPAVWQIVLETTIMGRIVGGRDDDAVGKSGLKSSVVRENRVGDRRGWGILIFSRNHDIDPLGRQDLHRAGRSRHR